MNKQNKQKTMKLSIFISLVLSISIILLILYFTINDTTINYLTTQNIKYEYFFIAAGISILFWFIWGLRLKILSNSIDKNVKISFWESTKIVIANLFLANITPSLAGGEPVRIYLLNKNGLSVGSATAAVLGERLLDAIFLMCCFPFAFYILRNHIDIGPLKIGLTIAIIVFIIVIFAFLYALKNPSGIKSFLSFITNKLYKFFKKKEGESKLIEKINDEVDNFHESMVFFLSEGKIAFIKSGIVTVMLWLTGWLTPSFIFMGLGLDPFVIESYAAQVLLIIIAMMPTTPGSAGVTEGGAAALFSVFINSSLIGVFILLYRFITYHMGLIAGAIFQYRIFKSVASFSLDSIRK